MANITESVVQNVTDIVTTTLLPITSTILPTTSTTTPTTTTTTTPILDITSPVFSTTSDIVTEAAGIGPEIEAIPVFSRYVVYISVCSVCAALTLIAVFIILLKVFFFPDKFIMKNPTPSPTRRNSVEDLPTTPNPVQYHVTEYAIYKDSVNKRAASEKRRSSIYAKPEIYSTYINPAFYEDAYARWRRQEAENIYSSDPIYISPQGIRPVVFDNHIYATYSPTPIPRIKMHDVKTEEPIYHHQPNVLPTYHVEEDYEENGVEADESWDEESVSERPDDDEANCTGADPRISRISLLTHDNRRYSRSWHEDSDEAEEVVDYL